MKITSWNINSVRLRMPLVTRYVQEHRPDILCLQETKADDPVFPRADLEALGFPHIAFSGEKSYNGVAILSKLPLSNVQTIDHAGLGHKRHITATLPDGTEIHNFYIPAGGDIPDTALNPKFAQKLAFVESMDQWSQAQPAAPRIWLGDFNIAPLEHDVWSHKQLLDVVSHTPIETDALNRLQARRGWVDALRRFVPETEKLYSWWSYRARDWEAADKGRRLDHIWVSPELESRLQGMSIQKAIRGWEKPSDHVPVEITLAA